MSATLPITEARAHFGSLVRRASHARERVTITDHGEPAVVLISPRELAELEESVLELREALAVAQYRAEQAAGTVALIPHEELLARLGLDHE